jgi:hypothetical protein
MKASGLLKTSSHLCFLKVKLQPLPDVIFICCIYLLYVGNNWINGWSIDTGCDNSSIKTPSILFCTVLKIVWSDDRHVRYVVCIFHGHSGQGHNPAYPEKTTAMATQTWPTSDAEQYCCAILHISLQIHSLTFVSVKPIEFFFQD